MNLKRVGVLFILVGAMLVVDPFFAHYTLAEVSSIRPGSWKAATGFGGFAFTVNTDATGISMITFNFSDYRCGPSKLSGKISVQKEMLWPIAKRAFVIETNLKLYRIIIKGNFDETGRHAQGTWQIITFGKTCSGTWESKSIEKGQMDKGTK